MRTVKRQTILIAGAGLLAGGSLLWFSWGRSMTHRTVVRSPVGEEGAETSEPDEAVLELTDADILGAREPHSPDPEVGEVSRLAIAALEPGRGRLVASVSAEDDSGSRSLGTTTSDRLLGVDTESLSFPIRLIATTEGEPRLIGQVVLGSLPPAELVEIELRPACVLAGSVVDARGRPLPAGVRIIALDPLRRLAWLEDRSSGRRPVVDGRWAETFTDANGRFALSGLLPGRSYLLSAAGAGFVTNGDISHTRYACGEAEITLTAYALFGGIARIGTQRTDELVREASLVFFGTIPLLHWPEGSFPANPASEPALAGTAIQEQARGAAAEGRRVVAFTASQDVISLKLKAQVRVPFLPADWHEIELPRVEGLLADIAVPVPEPEGPFSSLEIVALTTPGGVERLDPTAKVGQLRLKRRSQTFEVTVRAEPLLTGFSIPGLPVGTYEWSLHCTGGERLLPRGKEPNSLVMVTESGGTLLLDLTWTGAAELRVRDREGVLLAGSIQAGFAVPMEVTPLSDGGKVVGYDMVASMSWKKPPYVAPFVPPGEFEVSCEADFGRGFMTYNQVTFEFRAGSMTAVELHVPR